MKLGQKALAKLAEWGGFADDPRRLVVESDRLQVALEVRTADRLSCALGALDLEPRQARVLDADALRAWGQRVGSRVRYMLEAIETVELDAVQGRLLLRSTPPEKKGNDTLYYELLLDRTGRLHLERRRYDAAARTRGPEPLHCTHELLEKLVNDLAATAP